MAGTARGRTPAAGATPKRRGTATANTSAAAKPAAGGNVEGLTLVLGAETFLAERAVHRLVTHATSRNADLVPVRLVADAMSEVDLDEAVGEDLFGGARCVVIERADALTTDAAARIVAAAGRGDPDLTMVVVHPGGTKGRSVVTAFKNAGVTVIACDKPSRADDYAAFVTREAIDGGGRIDTDAARLMVTAAGQDLRTLAGLVAQFLADGDGRITTPFVEQYLTGRAEVRGWTVADHAVAGRTDKAVSEAAWAMATGTDAVPIVAAVAGSLRTLIRVKDAPPGASDGELAAELGMAGWLVGAARRNARPWTPDGLAAALVAVADADLAVKGGSSDNAFAVTDMLVKVGACRRSG